MYTPKAKSFYSGAGLLDIGIMQSGVDIIQSMDIDPEATDSMKRNPHYFNHRIITGSVSEKLVLGEDDCDMMLFTYPCTKYSPIADIHDARTGDEHFLHALRFVAIGQPEMYVIENVPGMKKFKVVMEAMTKLPGYYVHVFCPIKAELWLPQKRDRLIVIATRKQSYIEAPAFTRRISLKEIIEQDPVYEMPAYVVSRINGKYRDKPIIVDPSDTDALAPTCVAHYAKDMGTRLVKDRSALHGARPFSVREYARLQGVPDDYRFENKRSSYRMIGNGVAVPVGRWIGEQAMKYFN